MKNDFLRSVVRFVTVADEGSIQAASRALNISQPSLTLSIAKIEEGFGTRLFDRSKRGVTLTAAGALLYPRAKEILAQGAMARTEIEDVIRGGSGRFHIRAGSSWGYCYLPEIIADLKGEFPNLDITFNIGNTVKAFPQLLSGEIDAIIGNLEDEIQAAPGIGLVELTQIRSVLVCGDSHPLAGRANISKATLRNHAFVVYEPDMETLQATFAPPQSDEGEALRIALHTRSPHAALEMVGTGHFLAYLSRPFVHKYKTANMRILDVNFPLRQIQSGIRFRETLTPTDPFQSLMAKLKKAARRIEQL